MTATWWCPYCDEDVECRVPERAFDPNTGEEIVQRFTHLRCGAVLISHAALRARAAGPDAPPPGASGPLDEDAVMDEIDRILRRL